MKLVRIFVLFFILLIYAEVQAQAPEGAVPPVNPPLAGETPNIGATSTPVELSNTPIAAPNSLSQTQTATEGLSRRDPFRLPEYLIIKIRQKLAENSGPAGGVMVIDDSVEPIRRWPLGNYLLVGIIWDVKKPKAMFIDKMNNVHVLQNNDFIGNAKGVVVGIQNGSVTVLEGKIPQVIKLKK
jgi:Tfp pilus assembly protein PilP